jgi:cell division septal protein FtsQ
VDEHKRNQSHRNVRSALWLALVALGFYALFFWSMSHRAIAP